jgi:hypothetical protein
MIDGIRGAKLLDGFRGAPPADREALADLLHRISLLAVAHPEVVELDLNPLLALPQSAGVLAIDVRIRVG